MYRIDYSTTFKKSYKSAVKRGLPIEKFMEVVKQLSEGSELPAANKDHALKGKYKDCRECQVSPDWLLIYKIGKLIEVLYLIDTGTHSDLFGK